MDREMLLELIGINSLTDALDKTEVIIRQTALDSTVSKSLIEKQLNRGGKRLRPIILLLSSMAGGEPASRNTVKCAAAIEMIHQASLLHDNIMDEDIQAQSAHYLLAGDFLLAKALKLAAEVSSQIAIILSECICLMAEGQALQLSSGYYADPKNKVYVRTAGLKTASLFEAVCEVAAKINKFGDNETRALKKYGFSFGKAFQVIDDLTDNDFSKDLKTAAKQAALSYMDEAKSALATVKDSPAKKALAALAGKYSAAALDKSA